MPLTTLVAGTEAKVKPLNDNFEYLDDRVTTTNTVVSNHTSQIATINSNVADLQTGLNSLGNTVSNLPSNDLITGLVITKTGNSSIKVTSGSCFDSTGAKILKLTSDTTKSNTGQSANTTYYVYIIDNSSLTSADILISTSAPTPVMPEGYAYYRQLGSYVTDSSGNISTIVNNNGGVNYSTGISMTGGTHTITSDGRVVTSLSTGNTFTQQLIVNGVEVYRWVTGNSNGAFNAIGHADVYAGDIVYVAPSGTFYPKRGE